MQSRTVRRAEPVDHRKRPDSDSHGVDHQRVAFVMGDGIAIPARGEFGRMLRIHPHMPDLMIDGIDDGDFAGLLKYLQSIGRKHERHASRPALVARGWIAHAGQRQFAVLLDDFCCLGLQDRIGVIADKPPVVAHIMLPARSVPQRSGTGGERFDARDRLMRPHPG